MGEPGHLERFELRGKLGAGATGAVHRVLDRLRGREVALKELTAFGPTAVYRFKREFRELCDLQHPNLIALHELYAVDDEWMFTMELVEGACFRDWVEGDEARLRSAMIQLADGLTALHATGKLHRDLKPTNVLVTPEDRLVILDFGLVFDPLVADATHVDSAVGTPAYMAPEQAADAPLTPAADWYAVGTMLYEALTQRKPFVSSPRRMLIDKQLRDPPRPRTVAPGAPSDLDELAMALLARDPKRRPDGPAVLAALGASPSAWTRRILDRQHPPAGIADSRGPELAAMHEALRDSREGAVVVAIAGRRGAGRTALLDAFARSLGDAVDTPVFRLRSGRREELPFPALDQLVDGLTRYLLSLPAAEAAAILPDDVDGLARMFPTLRRLDAARHLSTAPLEQSPETLAQRAVAAIAAMLIAIGARRPFAVLHDDAHWGTAVSASAAMAEMARPGAAHGLLVVTYDVGHEASAVVQAYLGFPGVRRLTVT